MKIHELAAVEQPYEKCQAQGPAALSDAELLATILRTGTKADNVLSLAHKVLRAHPVYEGVHGLNYLEMEDLTSIPGIGAIKATQILCACELSKRIAKANKRPLVKMADPKTICDLLMEDMRYLEIEHVHLLMFDCKYHLLRDEIISVGSSNSASITPRDIFICALKHHACHIILVHNHPSGDPEPSPSDVDITLRVANAGRMLGINLSDHIIIGNKCYVSMAERGIIHDET